MEAKLVERKETIVSNVHRILLEKGAEPPSLENYQANTILAYPVGDGGVVVYQSHNVAWLDFAFTTGHISLKTIRKIVSCLTLFEVDFVSVDCEQSTNPRYSRGMCEKFGFQKLRDDLYSLALR